VRAATIAVVGVAGGRHVHSAHEVVAGVLEKGTDKSETETVEREDENEKGSKRNTRTRSV